MMRKARWLLVLALLLPGMASAEGALSDILGDVSWGDPHRTVCKSVENGIMAEFKKEAANVVDIGKRDAMRARYEKDFERIKKTYRPIEDRRASGLATSIVQDEFLENNKEAVLVVREDTSTRYYFFLENQLYKIAISYQPEAIEGVAFEQFIGLLANRYGKDFKENYSEDDYLESVEWEESGTRLKIEDHTPIMKTYLLVFTNAALEEQVASKHAEARDARDAKWSETSSEIADLTSDPDEPVETSAASELVGEVEGVKVPASELGEKEGFESGSDTGSKTTDEPKRPRRKGSVKRPRGGSLKDKDLETIPVEAQKVIVVW